MVWPGLTVVLGGLAFAVSAAAVSDQKHATGDFWQGPRTLGAWAQPAFSSGFDALAIFATLIVAVAAMTGFSGDWSGLASRARGMFLTLTTLAVVILLGLATLTPSVIVASPGTASQSLLLWLVGWGVTLVTLAIAEVLPLRSQVIVARVRALRADRAAEHAGYVLPDRDAPPPPRPNAALLAVFGAPTTLWIVFSTMVAMSAPDPGRFAVVFALLGYGGLISLFGWMAGCDASASRLSRVASRALVVGGVIVSATFGYAISSVSGALSIGLYLMGAISLLLALPLSLTRRLPFVGTVQRWRTYSALHLIHARSQSLSEEWARYHRSSRRRPTFWSRAMSAWEGRSTP